MVLLSKIAALHDNELRSITVAAFRTYLDPVSSPVFQEAIEAGAQHHTKVTELKTKGDKDSRKKLAEMPSPFVQKRSRRVGNILEPVLDGTLRKCDPHSLDDEVRMCMVKRALGKKTRKLHVRFRNQELDKHVRLARQAAELTLKQWPLPKGALNRAADPTWGRPENADVQMTD